MSYLLEYATGRLADARAATSARASTSARG